MQETIRRVVGRLPGVPVEADALGCFRSDERRAFEVDHRHFRLAISGGRMEGPRPAARSACRRFRGGSSIAASMNLESVSSLGLLASRRRANGC